MFRFITFAATALASSAAWAGCSNYTDGSLPFDKPVVELCVGVECDRTELAYACGNVHGISVGYTNGMVLLASENRIEVRRADGTLVRPQDWSRMSCDQIGGYDDADACGFVENLN